jgi:hypothetical protein
MATAIYGASLWEGQNMEVNTNYDAQGKNSEAFTIGDPITYISGQLAVAGTTNSVAGVVQKTVTMAATNTGATGANVQPPYIPSDETTIWRMGCNANLTGNNTDGGTYYKLTANTTNTVQVDVTNGVQTTTSRVVMIKKVSPLNDGNLQDCLVTFVRRPTWIDQ